MPVFSAHDLLRVVVCRAYGCGREQDGDDGLCASCRRNRKAPVTGQPLLYRRAARGR